MRIFLKLNAISFKNLKTILLREFKIYLIYKMLKNKLKP